jgi:hypothetical protein
MSVELGLGLSVFSTIASVAGLVLHYVRFRKERPRLSFEVMSCNHYTPSTNIKKTELRVQFRVHNTGDRATQLNDLELREYQLMHSLDNVVEAHRSTIVDGYYNIPKRIDDNEIECDFTLYHTHGEENFKVTSERVSHSLVKADIAQTS